MFKTWNEWVRRFLALEERAGYRHCKNCPEVRLSEWFIAPQPGIACAWGMYCNHCGWVSPWLEHAPSGEGGTGE